MATDPFTYDVLGALVGSGFGTFDVPCPACGPERRSPVNRRRTVLRIYRGRPDFITFNCARCGAVGWVVADIGAIASEPRPAAAIATTTADAERTGRALRLWREGCPPAGTSVGSYLARRGLALSPGADGEAIRFHPRCPFGQGVTTPCMVALVRHVLTDEPIGIHRTAIAPGGLKAVIGGQSRMSLGPIGGGVVKLSPDFAVETVLGVGEGIESTLSLRLWCGCESLPVWAAVSASGLASFSVLPGVEVLWIAADRDHAGMAAVEQVRARWNAAGCDVEVVRPLAVGMDLNDLAMGGRHA
jgi:putative DNA primase/helicase